MSLIMTEAIGIFYRVVVNKNGIDVVFKSHVTGNNLCLDLLAVEGADTHIYIQLF